jgi:hypothetical protein
MKGKWLITYSKFLNALKKTFIFCSLLISLTGFNAKAESRVRRYRDAIEYIIKNGRKIFGTDSFCFLKELDSLTTVKMTSNEL